MNLQDKLYVLPLIFVVCLLIVLNAVIYRSALDVAYLISLGIIYARLYIMKRA